MCLKWCCSAVAVWTAWLGCHFGFLLRWQMDWYIMGLFLEFLAQNIVAMPVTSYWVYLWTFATSSSLLQLLSHTGVGGYCKVCVVLFTDFVFTDFIMIMFFLSGMNFIALHWYFCYSGIHKSEAFSHKYIRKGISLYCNFVILVFVKMRLCCIYCSFFSRPHDIHSEMVTAVLPEHRKDLNNSSK